MKITSKELVKILKQQKKVNEEIGENNKQLVKYDDKRKKLAYKVDRIKQKGVKILNKELPGKLEEFDYTGALAIIDDDSVEVDIHNAFGDIFKEPETLKEKLREDFKNKEGIWADPLMYTGHKK